MGSQEAHRDKNNQASIKKRKTAGLGMINLYPQCRQNLAFSGTGK